jgi:hypothetical protein
MALLAVGKNQRQGEKETLDGKRHWQKITERLSQTLSQAAPMLTDANFHPSLNPLVQSGDDDGSDREGPLAASPLHGNMQVVPVLVLKQRLFMLEDTGSGGRG